MDRLDQIRETFAKNGTRLGTGEFRRYDKRFEVIRDVIASGEIGTPSGAIFFGASSLMHGHIHTIDTLSFLLGDPGIVRVRGKLPRYRYHLSCILLKMAAISLRTGELPDVDAASMAGNHVPEDPEAVYELEFANGVMATSAHTGSGAVCTLPFSLT